MPQDSTLYQVSSTCVPCIPYTRVCLPMVIQVEISLYSKATSLVCYWQQTQQLGRCVNENGSPVPLPHCIRSLCISTFMEGRRPDNSYAISPPKLVLCFLILHLPPTPATSLHVLFHIKLHRFPSMAIHVELSEAGLWPLLSMLCP